MSEKSLAWEDNECATCGEDVEENECPNSPRPCGHHCNHSWTHDSCCWCGTEWDGEDEIPPDQNREIAPLVRDAI